VAGAGVIDELEVRVSELEERAAKPRRQLRAPAAVAGVAVLVHPASVVEDGEERHNFELRPGRTRKPPPVLDDAGRRGPSVPPLPSLGSEELSAHAPARAMSRELARNEPE
jgi:hypothetical protein